MTGSTEHDEAGLHATILFTPDDEAPQRVRRALRDLLTEHGVDGGLLDDVVLGADELVANVAEHVHADEAGVILRVADGVLRVDVFDPLPVDVTPGGVHDDAEPPRVGLRIVDRVCDRWGVMPTDTGKSVWFEVDLG